MECQVQNRGIKLIVNSSVLFWIIIWKYIKKFKLILIVNQATQIILFNFIVSNLSPWLNLLPPKSGRRHWPAAEGPTSEGNYDFGTTRYKSKFYSINPATIWGFLFWPLLRNVAPTRRPSIQILPSKSAKLTPLYRAGRPICHKVLLCFSMRVVRACLPGQ